MFLLSEKEEQNFVQTIRNTEGADGDQGGKSPEQIDKAEAKAFEESIEYKFSEEYARIIPYMNKYIIHESDLYAVNDYYNNDDIDDTFNLIADKHNINKEDIVVMTESINIEEMKKEITNRLHKTKSEKQKKKLRIRLKNLNKMKFFRRN